MKNKITSNHQLYYSVRHRFFNSVYDYLYPAEKNESGNSTKIEPKVLKKFIKEAINTYSEEYKKKFNIYYSKNQSNIFRCLIAEQANVSESTISKWFSTDYGSIELKEHIYKTISEITGIDINILTGKDRYGIIECAKEYHNTSLESGNQLLELSHKKLCISNKSFYFDTLSQKEQVILVIYHKELIDCFKFYNDIFDAFCYLSEDEQERFNGFLEVCFPDDEIESNIKHFEESDENSDFFKIKKILNDIQNADDYFKQHEYDTISFSKNQLNDIPADDMRKMVINLNTCFDTTSDNVKIALLFSTLSDKDKMLVDLFMKKLLSNEDYIE